MADKHKSQGAKLYMATELSPTTFVQVNGLKTFDGPGGSVNIIDVSDLDSTAVEKLAGLPDEGQISFGANFISGDDGQLKFRQARAAQERRQFRLDIPASTQSPGSNPAKSIYFFGFPSEYKLGGAVNGVVSLSLSIEIDGSITIV